MKRILFISAAMIVSLLAEAETFKGLVVSDCRSYNNCLNQNIKWDEVDLTQSLRTVYVQSEDGSEGIRITLDNIYENKFMRGDLVVVDLGKAKKSDRSFSLPCKALTIVSRNNPIPEKRKKIADICPSDIYTLVTIEDLEFLSKQGSLINIYERCGQKTPENICDACFHVGDGWASLLEDGNGDHIYVQINSKVPGRRNRLDFPKGIGSITGVIVDEYNRRYGCPFGLSIRPIFLEDIRIAEAEESHFTSIASWRYDWNPRQSLNFRDAGILRWMEKGICGDALIAEKGDGLLYTNSGAAILPWYEYDARHTTDGSGRSARAAGAIRFNANASDWEGTGIIIEANTVRADGRKLIFNFSFVAGDNSLKNSSNFPAIWTVQWSFDGNTWNETGEEAFLRPMAFRQSLKDHKFFHAPYDAAMGYPEYSVKLPDDLCGKEKVFIRIVPKGTSLVIITPEPDKDIVCGDIKRDECREFALCVGMVELKYY